MHTTNMLNRSCFVLLTCVTTLVFAILEKQPDFVKTCYLKDPEFVNCSTHAVQNLFNQLPHGLPEIDLEPLDPLYVPKVKILQGAGPVNVNASLSNVKVTGFGKAKILYNKVDPVTHDFHTKLVIPKLRIEGKYVLLGRILVIPLRGEGTCWFDAQKLEIYVKNDVDLIKKQGFNFFNITGINVRFTIGGLSFRLNNLFEGIKALEESTNVYLNQNWRPVADSLNPILTKTIENIMLRILKKVFDNVPGDFFIGDL